jgi:hypothetical protein
MSSSRVKYIHICGTEMFHWCVFYTKNHQNRLIKGKELILRSLKMGNEQITDKERSHQAKKVTLIAI